MCAASPYFVLNYFIKTWLRNQTFLYWLLTIKISLVHCGLMAGKAELTGDSTQLALSVPFPFLVWDFPICRSSARPHQASEKCSGTRLLGVQDAHQTYACCIKSVLTTALYSQATKIRVLSKNTKLLTCLAGHVYCITNVQSEVVVVLLEPGPHKSANSRRDLLLT